MQSAIDIKRSPGASFIKTLKPNVRFYRSDLCANSGDFTITLLKTNDFFFIFFALDGAAVDKAHKQNSYMSQSEKLYLLRFY